MAQISLTPEQEKADRERTEATDRILKHAGHKKVVIAGPGTGKTHLFKQLFATKAGGKMLTLTFINALVEDLSLELQGISEVRTLHGYALSIFGDDAKIYPTLPDVIQEDGEVLLGTKLNFPEKMHNMNEEGGHLDFYNTRRKYYDRFGYSDIVMGLVKFFEQNPDKVPEYAQIVVDEFQDFNKLEVTLIEQLSKKSPILIAGDDDQAIYEFKNSSPDFIRALHSNDRPEFENFPLPFCSRSTRVIVDGINDFIASAIKNGFLEGRVNKPYIYFPCPPKDAESAEYPKIAHKRLEDKQIPWFIQTELEKLATRHRKKFDVLVITPFSAQCERIAKTLRSKGMSSVEYKEKDRSKMPYMDGLRVLMEEKTSNLGWRLVSKALLSKDDFDAVIKMSEDCSKPFKKLLAANLREDVEADVKTLCALTEDEPIDKEAVIALLRRLGCKQEDINKEFLVEKLGDTSRGGSSPSIRKMPITVTTVQSSKGLAADYVFITHFDRRYLGTNGLSNQSICNFLVALTRARKKVWLLSTSNDTSPFLGWIDKAKIESI